MRFALSSSPSSRPSARSLPNSAVTVVIASSAYPSVQDMYVAIELASLSWLTVE